MQITVELVNEVLEQIFEGHSLNKVLKDRGISRTKFFEAVDNNPLLQTLYARAQHSRSELNADEIIYIADTEPDPQRARNRIDARKWLASKLQPSKYGDRLDLNLQGQIDIAGALAEGLNRALPGRNQGKVIDAEHRVIPTESLPAPAGSKPVEQTQPTENRDADKIDPSKSRDANVLDPLDILS